MLSDERGMAMFDFGTQCPAADQPPVPYQETCNQAKYGELEPIRDDLSKVTVKAAVLHGARQGFKRSVHAFVFLGGGRVDFCLFAGSLVGVGVGACVDMRAGNHALIQAIVCFRRCI